MTTTSSLPPFEEMHDAFHVKITNLQLSKCSKLLDQHTSIKMKVDNLERDLITDVYVIDDPMVGEYLPSKVWNSLTHGIMLLYYVSKSLPDGVRAFKNGRSYAIVIECVDPNVVIEYDASIRLLIDQVPTPTGISYVIMFADDVIDKLILSAE